MSKERFLTVLIPIKDSDCESTVYESLAALNAAVPPSASNINKIYKLKDGTYQRVHLVLAATPYYEYHTVVDREFPYLGNPMEIYNFTYTATRMGTAPTISAQDVRWYAEKNGSGEDITLDGLWTQMCHVKFNGENLYLKQIPTSKKDNEDARYKYNLDFVAERVILERVYFYDIVSPFVTEKPLSQSSKFSFYGDISELADRINASLIRSGLATLVRKYVYYEQHPSMLVPYLTYEQWNNINVNPSLLVGTGKPFTNAWEVSVFRYEIYRVLDGDYNRYLMEYIYENDNGVYAQPGYKCIIGVDKYGNQTASEEKLINFENAYIYNALQEVHDTFELEYYITCEKDGNGNFTGNTLIVIGDCEYDFADIDSQTGDYVRDDDGVPTTENPFDYGVEDELLSKEKNNTTDKIVTRITGVGSSDNIPWYYPNPNPDGWIKPVFTRNGSILSSVAIDYPEDEGTTVADNVRFEKYIKNRIGADLKKGILRNIIYETGYSFNYAQIDSGVRLLNLKYIINTDELLSGTARMTLVLNYNEDLSKCSRVVAGLSRGSTVVGTYDSSESYANPTDFQQLFISHNGKSKQNLSSDYNYVLDIQFSVPEQDVPVSERFDYEGYRYPSVTYDSPTSFVNKAYIRENFYVENGLLPFVVWGANGVATDAGYSIDGTASGKVAPMNRHEGKQYKDATTGEIYKCLTSEQGVIQTSTYQNGFSANPVMSWDEWMKAFVDMRIGVYTNDGWYLGYDKIDLADYGLSEPYIDEQSAYYTDIFDAIKFQRVKYITPQSNLMPEVYIKTDGERRCYNSHNYWDTENDSLFYGIADTAIGEEQVDGVKVRNPLYKENTTDPDNEHYEFENEYIQQLPYEHIENFDDVKPTIKGQTNEIDGTTFRIDVVEMFAYDQTDNDEIWESEDENSVQGEYKHPCFFAKLRPLGFNIFDLALQNDMVVSMTTGNCGACNFRIGVDENYGKNPVQLWEYDVYGGDTFEDKGEKLYSANELRRYIDLTGLHYDTNGRPDGYISIQETPDMLSGEYPFGYDANIGKFYSYNYTAESVESGMVGSMKHQGSVHFEGDVVTSGKFQESQQDTSENYVWVALFKDTETYGTIMPSARQSYNETNYNLYIRPKSIADVHTQSSTPEEDEENADKFVFTNIKLPQVYLRRAERELSRKLIEYMFEHNFQKFNFNIKFSRIYIADNVETDDNLNENSVLYVRFNGKTYRQYVKNYTYTMSSTEPLPEMTVNMNEELSASKTINQQWDSRQKKNNDKLISQVNLITNQVQNRLDKTKMSKDGTPIMSGNIIVQGENTSLVEIARRGYGGGGTGVEWGEF